MENIPTLFVVFGATGDLMTKKIIPSIFTLDSDNKLEETFKVIGFSRRDYTDEDYRGHVTEVMKNYNNSEELKISKKNLDRFHFVSSHFNEEEGYSKLLEKINEITSKQCPIKILFYLAVAPEFYTPIINNLRNVKNEIEKICEHHDLRLLIEKPIGKNKEEAIKLDKTIKEVFTEDQVYRIDHYLQKKITRNIFAFRFYNNTFKASWNNKFIEKIEIITNEEIGVENRGMFYDGLGTLRDVGQNHLLELLALTTMEEPSQFTEEEIRKERVKLLRNIKKLNNEEIKTDTFRAQYKGYEEIKDVKPNSKTETYFKLKTQVDNPLWRNVEVYLEAGKRVGEKPKKEVIITFRKVKKKKSSSFNVEDSGQQIKFQFAPHEQINLGFDLMSTDENMYCEIKDPNNKHQYIAEYMQVILEAIKGDRTWFVGFDEVIAEWEFIDPIIEAWEKDEVPLGIYEPNTIPERAIRESHPLLHSNHPINQTQLGIIGLGKMGGGIAKQFIYKNYEVVAYNRSSDKTEDLVKFGAIGAYSIEELVKKLRKPRVVWVMLPAGEATEDMLFGDNGVVKYLEKDDIIIDAANGFYKDAIRRGEELKKLGIKFLDVGVSGGPSGARNGACIMVGGEKEIFNEYEHFFEAVSLPGGYKFFEGYGAGHFVKMVHNGIEYGMMQAIGEGFEVLKKADYNLDLAAVTELYNRGSVIESRLVDWLYKAYVANTIDLNGISGEVNHSGEGLWTVETAKEFGIPVKVIEDALQFRIDSQGNPSYTGKVVSALRNQFGGHDVNEK